MSFSKQAMVLNYQTIFHASNGFELLNHVSSKQSIFYKTGLTKIPSFNQAMVSASGVLVDLEKVEAVMSWERPKSFFEIRNF